MIEEWGSIEILVANAGIQRDAPFHQMTLEQWDTVMKVNLTGQFLCSREAVREFNRRGLMPEVSRSTGKIIGMSSVHDVIPWAGHVNYAASKGGLMMFVKSLAQEVAHRKIRVNAISPGAIRQLALKHLSDGRFSRPWRNPIVSHEPVVRADPFRDSRVPARLRRISGAQP
jgi:glucose 1-dehydrogenase